MGEKLTIRYDSSDDILYIDTRPPYAEQDSEEIDDQIVARFNPTTKEIENLEVIFFSQRGGRFELPVAADLRAS